MGKGKEISRPEPLSTHMIWSWCCQWMGVWCTTNALTQRSFVFSLLGWGPFWDGGGTLNGGNFPISTQKYWFSLANCCDLRSIASNHHSHHFWFIHPLNDATIWAKVVFPHLDVLVAAIGHDLQKWPDMHRFVAGLATMNRFQNCKSTWWILLYMVTCLDISMKLPATTKKHVIDWPYI